MNRCLVLLVIYIFLLNKNVKSQFTYEHSYYIPPGGEALFVTNLGNNDYKYVLIDYYSNKFDLYNLDHSPFISNIQLPLPSDSFAFFQVGYITSTLFDCDSTNVEYALMNQTPINNGKFMVYRTDGTQLFSRDSVSVQYGYGYNVGSVEIHGIENTPAGTKLFLFNQQREIFVYGLCGVLPDEIKSITQSESYVNVFPNPADKAINFDVFTPKTHDTFKLNIYDLAFQLVKTILLQDGQTRVNLQIENLNDGNYFYSLQTKSKVFQTGKFTIVK